MSATKDTGLLGDVLTRIEALETAVDSLARICRQDGERFSLVERRIGDLETIVALQATAIDKLRASLRARGSEGKRVGGGRR